MATQTKEIAFGVDGCVYKPAFNCAEGHKYPEKNYISKLMRKGMPKVKEEIDNYLSLGLQELDPDMQFFISEPEECTLTAADTENYYRSKENCNDVSRPYKAINYVDGGKDLFVVLETINDIYDSGGYVSLNEIDGYFDAFNNIINGVAVLNENNIYHLDIKPENIVYTKKEPYSDFKLIDFGMSRNAAVNPPTTTFGTPPYIPPEMYMFNTKDKTIRENYIDYFARVAPSLQVPLQKPPLAYYEAMPNEQKYEKADVWAIGMTLLDMYNTVMAGPYDAERLEIYNLLKEKIIDLMLSANVEERLSIQEAQDMYNDFMFEITKMPKDPRQTTPLRAPSPPLSKTAQTKRRSMGGIKQKIASKKNKKWSLKYKKSIYCNRPHGFSQKQYCKYGRKKTGGRKTRKNKK